MSRNLGSVNASSPRVVLVSPSPPPYGGMALQAKQLEQFLRRDGIDVVFLHSNRAFPPALLALDRVPAVRTVLRSLLLSSALWRELRRADILHLMAASWVYFFAVVWPAVVIARLLGKRVILNYRGGEADRFFSRFAWAAWPVFRLASAVTVPSGFLAGIIDKHFRCVVQIVPNFVDLAKFEYRQRRSFRPALLVTRHLETIYDIPSVLRAFKEVQASYPDASLQIAGTGREESALRSLATDLRVNHVHFLGSVPHDRLPALYRSCDVYINASRVDNFPGALVEASACGLAIVSTAAGGIPFLYSHGESAILVEAGDWKALAMGVRRIVESPEAGVALTECAREVALACDWNEVCRRLYQAYGPAFEPFTGAKARLKSGAATV